jgi:hypothetical protein
VQALECLPRYDNPEKEADMSAIIAFYFGGAFVSGLWTIRSLQINGVTDAERQQAPLMLLFMTLLWPLVAVALFTSANDEP